MFALRFSLLISNENVFVGLPPHPTPSSAQGIIQAQAHRALYKYRPFTKVAIVKLNSHTNRIIHERKEILS